MDLQLKGKRALVTGSSNGIGATMATWLATEGVKLIIHGRKEDAAKTTAAMIVEAGGEAKVVLGDLSEPENCNRVADEALAAFGGVDILVNNAGFVLPSTWDTTNPDDWSRLYATNVVPAVRLSHRFAPMMQQAGWGRLIHIGSSAAAVGLPKAPEYAASKAALAAMSSSLAKHYGGGGVTSNILGVGTIANLAMRTGMGASDGTTDPIYEMIVNAPMGFYNRNPLNRTGTSEEVAYIVTMLASPLSSFVNGALIRVDGGKVPSLGL